MTYMSGSTTTCMWNIWLRVTMCTTERRGPPPRAIIHGAPSAARTTHYVVSERARVSATFAEVVRLAYITVSSAHSHPDMHATTKRYAFNWSCCRGPLSPADIRKKNTEKMGEVATTNTHVGLFLQGLALSLICMTEASNLRGAPGAREQASRQMPDGELWSVSGKVRKVLASKDNPLESVLFPRMWDAITDAGRNSGKYNVSEMCSAGLSIYTKSLDKMEPWAIRSKSRSVRPKTLQVYKNSLLLFEYISVLQISIILISYPYLPTLFPKPSIVHTLHCWHFQTFFSVHVSPLTPRVLFGLDFLQSLTCKHLAKSEVFMSELYNL